MEQKQSQFSRSATAEIVVGLDHTPAGSAALRWAALEAHRRAARLTVIHVYDRAQRADLHNERDHDGERARARVHAHQAILDALQGPPGGQFSLRLVEGSVADSLVRAARSAELLVVGKPTDSRNSPLPDRLAGSLTCPVVVVDAGGEADVRIPAAPPEMESAELDAGELDARLVAGSSSGAAGNEGPGSR